MTISTLHCCFMYSESAAILFVQEDLHGTVRLVTVMLVMCGSGDTSESLLLHAATMHLAYKPGASPERFVESCQG